MAPMIEMLIRVGEMPRQAVKPFKTWEGSTYRDWEFTFKLLDVSDNSSVLDALSPLPGARQILQGKIETLARSIITVEGQPLCTEDDVEKHNRDNNLTGNQEIGILAYKVQKIGRWQPLVLDQLYEAYLKLLEQQSVWVSEAKKSPPTPGTEPSGESGSPSGSSEFLPSKEATSLPSS